jgi:hypothetical protein
MNEYYLNTKGTFNVVSTHKIKSMFNAFKLQGFDINTSKKGDVFTFRNKEYKLDFVSFGKYGSLSIYFIIDNKQLLRISDHWSEGCKKLIVKDCGFISSCYWKLQGNSFPLYYHLGSTVLKSLCSYSYYGKPYGYYKDWVEITNCLLAGVIQLNELKKIN